MVLGERCTFEPVLAKEIPTGGSWKGSSPLREVELQRDKASSETKSYLLVSMSIKH